MRAHEFVNEDWKQKAAAGALGAALSLGAVNVKHAPFVPKPVQQVQKKIEKATGEYLESFLKKVGFKGSELAQFMAQAAHETSGFDNIEENLRYTTGERLYKMFTSSFSSPAEAEQFVKNPEAIANRVYANRLGNGNEASGDGWKYRGRGYFHLTGRENYRKAGEALGLDLENNPDLVVKPDVAARTALWFWRTKVKPSVTNYTDVKQATKPINPRLAGIKDRIKRFKQYNEPNVVPSKEKQQQSINQLADKKKSIKKAK